jgi:transcriptional regulator of arginine metabolism
MKLQRQNVILRLVADRRVRSQDELRELLATEGFQATQATLSRDIRELGLAKLTDSDGSYYGSPRDTGMKPDVGAVLPALLISVDGVGPLVVCKTVAGSAAAVGVAIDSARWKEIIGTVAGDDTCLIITRGPEDAETVTGRIRELSRR